MADPNSLHWYVAYVKPSMERRVAQNLGKIGVENFLPTQKIVVQYSDRKKLVERLVITRMIFIRTDEHTRTNLYKEIYGIQCFMTNGGTYHPVIIPDYQMDAFRFMVTRSKNAVSIEPASLKPGDRVRVINGPLAGLECDLVEVDGTRMLSVSVGALGCAKASISVESVEKIEESKEL